MPAKWAQEREALLREVEALFEGALACVECGDMAGASTEAAATLVAYPYHVGALNLRGTLTAMRGDFVAAAADFERAVSAAPDDPASLFNLAQAQERLDRAADAASSYRRVLALESAYPHASVRLAAIDPPRALSP